VSYVAADIETRITFENCSHPISDYRVVVGHQNSHPISDYRVVVGHQNTKSSLVKGCRIAYALMHFFPTPHNRSYYLAAVAERSPAQRRGAEAAPHPASTF
jgi:hypothetical protein